MNDWLERFQFLVNKAAANSDLSQRKGGGFDGEGWAWIWRDRNEKGEKTQVRLRAKPNVRGDVIDVHVFASACAEEHPQDSWSRIYTRHIGLESGQLVEETDAVNQMTDALRRALKDAKEEGIPSLEITKKRRVELIEDLRKRHILEPQSNYKIF